jgi:hypothetical protein
MGFLKRLLGGGGPTPAEPAGWNAGTEAPAWPPPGPISAWPTGDVQVQGSAIIFDVDHRQYVDVVGESFRQENLERLAGGRTREGARNADHMALLLPEPGNPKDANAVRVILAAADGGAGLMVGYLSREDAIAFRPVIDRVAESGRVTMCHARLKGGWDRGISFGVMLRIGPPWSLMAELDTDLGPDPRWPSQVVLAADPQDRPYNRTDCPHCGVVFDPLPKAKKKCPACGLAVYVRSSPDDIRYLLREADLDAMEVRWEEHLNR